MITKGVILAAGLGTRLYPLTYALPKEMLPLGRKPAIQHVVEELEAAGLRDLLIVTGRHKGVIEDHFEVFFTNTAITSPESEQGTTRQRLRLFTIRQRALRGTGDAVAHAEPFVGSSSFAVAFGDSVISSPSHPTLLERMMETHETKSASATLAVRRVPRQRLSSYGVVQPAHEPSANQPFRISDIIEKPQPASAPSDYALAARYLFCPAVFGYIAATPPSTNGEIQLTDAIRAMALAGEEVWAVPLLEGESRYDVGNFLGYAEAFCAFALVDEGFGKEIRQFLGNLLEETQSAHGRTRSGGDE